MLPPLLLDVVSLSVSLMRKCGQAAIFLLHCCENRGSLQNGCNTQILFIPCLIFFVEVLHVCVCLSPSTIVAWHSLPLSLYSSTIQRCYNLTPSISVAVWCPPASTIVTTYTLHRCYHHRLALFTVVAPLWSLISSLPKTLYFSQL